MEPILSTPQAPSLHRCYIRISIIVGLLLIGFFIYTNEPPKSFPVDTLITVKADDTITSVAKELKAKHLVRSATMAKVIVMFFAGKQKLVVGDYYFNHPISTYSIASRLINGNFDFASVKITIPEGITMSQIAALLAPKLIHFSTADFMKYSPEKEGYLFPDTYFFAPDSTASAVIDVMQKNFDDKIKSAEPAIAAFGKPEKDVIIMASILEKEARTTQDWQIISGILWKRLKIGMPLQVDSTTNYITSGSNVYISNPNISTTTIMDSPYNTYTHKGLPPTPIANPGLETITAAVTPTTTPYLYYLSDQNGVIHYAATFADHVKNRQKYLQ